MPDSEIEREILIQVLKSRLDTHYHSAMEAANLVWSIGVALLVLGATLFLTGQEKGIATWFIIGGGIGLLISSSRFSGKIPRFSKEEHREMKRRLAQLQKEEGV
jgi:hypothetical protein